jgi:hypothetical protein
MAWMDELDVKEDAHGRDGCCLPEEENTRPRETIDRRGHGLDG